MCMGLKLIQLLIIFKGEVILLAKKGRKGNIKVTRESKSGRNKKFKDETTGRTMTRAELNKAINNGTYSGYHVRNVNGKKTPVSNPDSSKRNNLG